MGTISPHGTILPPRTSNRVSEKDIKDGERSPVKTFRTSHPTRERIEDGRTPKRRASRERVSSSSCRVSGRQVGKINFGWSTHDFRRRTIRNKKYTLKRIHIHPSYKPPVGRNRNGSGLQFRSGSFRLPRRRNSNQQTRTRKSESVTLPFRFGCLVRWGTHN